MYNTRVSIVRNESYLSNSNLFLESIGKITTIDKNDYKLPII